MTVSEADVERFLQDGYLRLEGAFSAELAAAARALWWQELPGEPGRPETWTSKSVRLGHYSGGPFAEICRSPCLAAAFDRLAGAGRWQPLESIGSVMVRFPGEDRPNHYHWHVDMSFAGPEARPGDYEGWRVNVRSRDRLLQLLMLFSGVGEQDAPTRLRVGSHLPLARHLAPAGEAGLWGQLLDDVAAEAPVALATGAAGTVYLCHPLLIHAGQPHRGREPRFMAQPPLRPLRQASLDRADGDYSPVELAIRRALGR